VLLHEHLIEQGFLDDFHGDIHPAMCAAALASTDQDVITGLFMTPSGAALMDSYSVLPATTA
jgi:hypothetical protein